MTFPPAKNPGAGKEGAAARPFIEKVDRVVRGARPNGQIAQAVVILRRTKCFANSIYGTGCGKTQSAVILSEAKNLSLFVFSYLNRREILRFAQNDKIGHFFRNLARQL
jgi:hypothetical protein